jgi:DNA protecting protein DprA
MTGEIIAIQTPLDKTNIRMYTFVCVCLTTAPARSANPKFEIRNPKSNIGCLVGPLTENTKKWAPQGNSGNCMAIPEELLEQTGLRVRGSIPVPLVAIIGTRTPSPEAAEAAFTVAKLLAGMGIGVVSGLALGIDGAAHRGCLAGGGRTVAVLGHGLHAPVYPAQHSALAASIAGRGALVSPYPDEVTVTKQTLLARNAVIARLARAVWVVQTGAPGGALAAAAHARKLGLPVLATPWDDPRWHAGCQSLLDHGAEPVDVLTAAFRLQALCKQPAVTQGVLAL